MNDICYLKTREKTVGKKQESDVLNRADPELQVIFQTRNTLDKMCDSVPRIKHGLEETDEVFCLVTKRLKVERDPNEKSGCNLVYSLHPTKSEIEAKRCKPYATSYFVDEDNVLHDGYFGDGEYEVEDAVSQEKINTPTKVQTPAKIYDELVKQTNAIYFDQVEAMSSDEELEACYVV